MVIAEIVTCIPFAADIPTPEHDLLRAFRAGDPDALASVIARVRTAVAPHAGRLFVPGTLAIAVPGHRAGSVNTPCEAVIRALAAAFPGLLEGPGVLVRAGDAPEAKAAGPRDPLLESATVRWVEALVPLSTTRVLLVDDVVRSGVTLGVVARAVPDRFASRTIALALFLAQP